MQIFRHALPLFAALTLSAAAHAAAPANDAGIKKVGPTCESCCCKKHDESADKKAGKSCCGGGGGGGGGGCCGGAKHDPQAMQAQRAIVAELKTAKTDAQRVQLLQRYIENVDAQMAKAHADHAHDAHAPSEAKPAKK